MATVADLTTAVTSLAAQVAALKAAVAGGVILPTDLDPAVASINAAVADLTAAVTSLQPKPPG